MATLSRYLYSTIRCYDVVSHFTLQTSTMGLADSPRQLASHICCASLAYDITLLEEILIAHVQRNHLDHAGAMSSSLGRCSACRAIDRQHDQLTRRWIEAGCGRDARGQIPPVEP